MKHLRTWQQSQYNLTEWRKRHPISDADAMPCYDEIAKWLSGYAANGEFLLDIGCKTGGLRKSPLFPPGVKYYGIDPLLISGGDYSFDFSNVSLEQFQSKAGYFDVVIIKDSVDYFEDPVIAFKKIRQLTKSGGCLLIAEGDHVSDLQLFLKILSIPIYNFLNASQNQPFFKKITGRIESVLVRIGFRPHCATHRDWEDTYPNGDLSRRQITKIAVRSGFEIAENTINDGRLYLALRNP